MLQAYSENVTFDEQSPIAFNNIKTLKGKSASLQGVSTIVFNECGLYKVTINGSMLASAAGLNKIQLYRNGVADPGGQVSFTAVEGSTTSFSFETTIQAEPNNPCPCSIPTIISVNNGDISGMGYINIVVDKIC